jgi:replicative DNA helicase
MSDLRESGCLTADTRVLRADTGAETTMGELYAAGARDVPVWALDDSLRYVQRHLTHVFPTGRKPVFRLRLASGKEVRATANHPFLTYDGWTPLGELSVGSRVGVPRHVPAPERVAVRDDDEVAALAERCSSGSLPTELFHLPKRQIALFLGTVWAAGGSVAVDGDGCRGRIAFASPRRELVDGLSRLLLRFGISTQLDSAEPDRYLLEVAGADDQRRFLQEIGVCGGDGEAAARLLPLVRAATARVVEPTEPAHVWDQVRDVLIGQRNTQSARLASA